MHYVPGLEVWLLRKGLPCTFSGPVSWNHLASVNPSIAWARMPHINGDLREYGERLLQIRTEVVKRLQADIKPHDSVFVRGPVRRL
jgi:hypothetical protein